MKIKTGLILVIAASLIFINSAICFSQEPTPQPEIVPQQPQKEAEVQWVWGEVVSVDTENKILAVKYLDYETDQEKEISISVDEKTTYENIKSIDEIEPLDSVSIDYIVSPEARNIATNISLEKAEAQPISEQGVGETTPEELQPKALPAE